MAGPTANSRIGKAVLGQTFRSTERLENAVNKHIEHEQCEQGRERP